MAECARCGSELLRLHCEDGGCAWVVCGDSRCGATTDASQVPSPYFERKRPSGKKS